MSEWWSYRPSSFLLFAPTTYYRLFELYNAALWPVHLALIVVCVAVLMFAIRGGLARGRVIAAALAIAWAWVAWGFHWQRYATINWAAAYFAVAFGIQALLLASAAARGTIVYRGIRSVRASIGWAIAAFAMVGQPLIALQLGRPWTQLEFAGLAPDPTAVATLGLLLAAARASWPLWVIPILWCAVTGLTLWTMNAADWIVAPLTAVVALSAALWLRQAPVAPASR
jgi:hypothetical protein